MDPETSGAAASSSTNVPLSDGGATAKPSGSSSTNFASAFGALKDTSLFAAARDVPALDPQQKQQLTAKLPSKNSVIVSSRQRGNPLLKHIRNVPYEYGEVVPDYVMGGTTCAVFLSLRYHRLNPQYIHDRLKVLGQQYQLRVLLLQIDVTDPHKELQQLSRVSVLADLTLMLAWSAEEAARIIEVYKMFEHKPPDLIMERQHTSTTHRLVDALSSISRISRPDAMTLLSNFGSLDGIVKASVQEIASCPGLGPQKAEKLHFALHQPFCKQTALSKTTSKT